MSFAYQSISRNGNMNVKVNFRFKDEITYRECTMTNRQYDNLRILPVIEECFIVDRDDVSLSEDGQEEFDQFIKLAMQKELGRNKK